MVAEKDFLKFKPSRMKKSFQEEKENFFAISNTQDGYLQERKQSLVELNDPESYDWDNLTVNK